jgi:hypothetical protein
MHNFSSERQAIIWKKLFAKPTSDKRLTYGKYKEL